MQYEHESLAFLRAGGREMHRWAAWHDDWRASSTSHLLAVWGFQARFSGQLGSLRDQARENMRIGHADIVAESGAWR